MRDIVVFSGNAHPSLAQEICDYLNVPLHSAAIERFSNDCLTVQLQASCRECDVFLIQPLVPPVQEHLVELLLMLDAARGASAGRITAVIPYYAYARSDKKNAPRISIAGRLMADLLVTAGANRVLTMTLHSPQVHGFFSVPVDHLNALQVLAEHFRDRNLENSVVVAPDFGSAKSATAFSRLLGCPVAAGSKRRVADDRVEIETIIGDVSGRNVIVLDDEIANAGTIVALLQRLRERQVGTITVACTHGLFTGQAVERLKAQHDIVEVVTTNTVPLAPEKGIQSLKVLSIAPLLGAAIQHIHNGESVSALFPTH